VVTSRRAALGLLGTASLAAGGVFAAPATAASGRSEGGALATAAFGRSPGSTPAQLRPGGEFDRFLAQRAEANQFSGTLLLARRDRAVFTRSYGMADRSRSVPNGRDTIFNLASVTKCFTAMAVSQLVERGKVHLHETLGTYLDGFSAQTQKVTIHQLLTHTAGMGNYPEAAEFAQRLAEWASVAEVMDGTMAIIRTMESQPRFTPGSQYRYSNSGYFVLGAIVAQVSGESYHDYVRRNVLGRAGMQRSDLYPRPQVLAGRDIAHPYLTRRPGEPVDFTTDVHFGFVGGPADGVYSTAPDLLRFATALREGRLVNRAFTDVFVSAKVPLSPTDPPVTPGQLRCYGYGFRTTILNGQLIVGHSGSGPGVMTNLDIYPDLGWVAVVLSNHDTPVDSVVQKERELITQLAAAEA
jgi:CubicO group peptidase (beta-lactamase class C family)